MYLQTKKRKRCGKIFIDFLTVEIGKGLHYNIWKINSEIVEFGKGLHYNMTKMDYNAVDTFPKFILLVVEVAKLV